MPKAYFSGPIGEHDRKLNEPIWMENVGLKLYSVSTVIPKTSDELEIFAARIRLL